MNESSHIIHDPSPRPKRQKVRLTIEAEMPEGTKPGDTMYISQQNLASGGQYDTQFVQIKSVEKK